MKQLTVDVIVKHTWKTWLVLKSAKLMVGLGIWDLNKICNMVENSLKKEVKENF